MYHQMADGAKRPRLRGSLDDRDKLRQLLHTGSISMVGLHKLIQIVQSSGIALDSQISLDSLREANHERPSM